MAPLAAALVGLVACNDDTNSATASKMPSQYDLFLVAISCATNRVVDLNCAYRARGMHFSRGCPVNVSQL